MNQVSFLAFGDDALSLKRKSSGGRAAHSLQLGENSHLSTCSDLRNGMHTLVYVGRCALRCAAATNAAAQLCLLLLTPLQ